MPRPKKPLKELVEDASFLARQHHERLLEPKLRWKSLAKLQDQYAAADTTFEKRRIGVEFEKAVRRLQTQRKRSSKPLAEHMAKLGPDGSAEQLKKFFPTYLRWPDGSRFTLASYQELTIDLGWEFDKHGRRIFKEIGMGVPRGDGKTPFWTGIALLELLRRSGRPKVFQASGAKDQAKLATEYASNWIADGEQLQAWLRPSKTTISRRDGRGEYSAMAANGSLGHGKKPDIGLIDEFWTIETSTQEKTVTALDTAMHKVPDGYWAWGTSAGYSKETLLGEAYDSALKMANVELYDGLGGRVADLAAAFHIRTWDKESGRLFLWWGLPPEFVLDLDDDVAMLDVIRRCNPAEFVNHRELLRALKRARDREDKLNEYIRFNLNGWTKTKGAWFPHGAWRSIMSAGKFDADKIWVNDPEIPEGSDIWVAVDAAKKRDTTCCAWASRLEDGRIGVRGRVWSARDDVPHHVMVPGGRIRNSFVESFISHELGNRYRVREVVYDTRFFDTQGENLADAGFDSAEFAQNSALMANAHQHWYEAVMEKTMTVPPDRVLAAQVEAAAAVLMESGWKVYKLKSTEPIDFVYAGSMARERCARATEKRQSAYKKRGIRTL